MTNPADQRLREIHDILNREDGEEALKQIREVVYREEKPPVVDKGLATWANSIRNALGLQAGIDQLNAEGGVVTYRFRGQNFRVTVEAV